jgi:phosphoglycolate phosphatase
MNRYKMVLFDFDGTLGNTEHIAFNIYNALAKKYDYRLVDKGEIADIKHMHALEVMKYVNMPLHEAPFRLNEGKRMMNKEMEKIDAFIPDIEEFFRGLAEQVDHIGILTSNTKKNVNIFLKRHKISEVEFIMCSALMSKSKKLKKVMKKYKFVPEDILYVGDEARDVDACKKTGVPIAAVSWGYNNRESLMQMNPEYMIDNLKELLEITKETI